MNIRIEQTIDEKIELLNKLREGGYLDELEKAGQLMVEALKKGNKIITAGNGGSAADAQHLAGELVGRFTMERKGLPSISLCVDPSVVTSIGNDYGYDALFARQIEALGNAGDVLVAISTSGNSKNLISAIEIAKDKGICVIALLGKSGGVMKDIAELSLVVPSNSCPRIQEIHTMSVHVLCEYIEQALFTS